MKERNNERKEERNNERKENAKTFKKITKLKNVKNKELNMHLDNLLYTSRSRAYKNQRQQS